MGLYLLQATGRDEAALGRARVIRQAFSGAAFVWGPLWLLAHRLWLAAAAWIIAELAFFAVAKDHLPGAVALAVGLVARLWLGTEAATLRSRKAARGTAVADVIAAASAAEAEVRFIERCREPAAATPVLAAEGSDPLTQSAPA